MKERHRNTYRVKWTEVQGARFQPTCTNHVVVPDILENCISCTATTFQSSIAGSLEAAYSFNWGAQEIWGKDGGNTLALL